eukprot:scaffold111106_cov66-Phaeocystis_antarctica.AAC.1
MQIGTRCGMGGVQGTRARAGACRGGAGRAVRRGGALMVRGLLCGSWLTPRQPPPSALLGKCRHELRMQLWRGRRRAALRPRAHDGARRRVGAQCLVDAARGLLERLALEWLVLGRVRHQRSSNAREAFEDCRCDGQCVIERHPERQRDRRGEDTPRPDILGVRRRVGGGVLVHALALLQHEV